MIAQGSFSVPHTHPPRGAPSPLKDQRLLRSWSQQDRVAAFYQVCASENGAWQVAYTQLSLGTNHLQEEGT